MEEKHELQMVFCVTCCGKLMAVHADSKSAFREQMILVNKGRVAELVPMVVTY